MSTPQDTATVQEAVDSSPKKNWSRWLYQSEGQKNTLVPKKLKIVGGGLGVIGICWMIFQEISVPTDRYQESVSLLPKLMGNEDRIELNTHFEIEPSSSSSPTSSSKKRSVTYSAARVIERPKRGDIPSGTEVIAILKGGARSGPIRAEVIQGVKIQGDWVVPTGGSLVGSAQASDDHLLIDFSELRSPDGKAQGIYAAAFDPDDRTPGLEGSVIGRQFQQFAVGLGANFIGGATEALQDSNLSLGGLENRPSVRNAVLSGTSRALTNRAQDLSQRMQTQTPDVHLSPGTRILVIFQ